MWPCCDFTSSDDDEHNTDSSFLLLFADIGIMPTLLDGLTDVDVLHIALGCRFALDILTVSQHYSSALELDPLPDYAFLDFLSLSVWTHNMQHCFASLTLVLAIVSLCSQMEGHQNASTSTGPSELKSLLLRWQLTLCFTLLPAGP